MLYVLYPRIHYTPIFCKRDTVATAPPRMPPSFPAVVYSDACEAGGGAVIHFRGCWWAAWWEWPPALSGEVIFFLEGRALIRALRFALDAFGLHSAPLLLRCDNLPFVQAAQRGCSTTRLGNQLLAELDDVAGRCDAAAVEWISTDTMLADAFSRASLGARPAGAGKAGDLVALDIPPLDPLGRPPPADCGAAGTGAKILCTRAPC